MQVLIVKMAILVISTRAGDLPPMSVVVELCTHAYMFKSHV